ncbi:hypothetical protein [Thalassospira sp. A3_1]|uniref:hypothetical protein n=1 Tax=Thalassospira sp. A3_1 TaxID=2821088 RepID=UPI001ADA68EF|nr:hypothetical protein [Thalassospira sp. A3_1]MBO9506671.1 hypothetical protein [Thalassospira sp. A3_1]
MSAPLQNHGKKDNAPDAAHFLHLVERTLASNPELSPVQGAILVAARQDIARDSKTFARLFGMAHAIVLRELNALLQTDDILKLVKRDPRTLRTHYRLATSS